MKVSNLILLSLFLFFISSCMLVEKKRIERKQLICSTCPSKTVVKDSIWEHITHDTITLPPIQGPVVILNNPCSQFCDSLGNLKPFFKKEKHNGITSTISTRPNKLVFECAADSLQAIVDKLEKESYNRKETTVEKLVFCTKEHESKLDSFFIVSGWGAWILIVLWLIWRILKTYFPILNFFG